MVEALGTGSPFSFNMVTSMLIVIMESHGLLLGDVGAHGDFSDGLVNLRVTNRDRGVALLKRAVIGTGFGAFAEIAFRDKAEQIWRHVYPAVPPGPFERWLTDDLQAARTRVTVAAAMLLRNQS
jgi:hypothetical protein